MINFPFMKKFTVFLFLLFIFILHSCEYQSSEVYNRPVNRDISPPNIQVVELNIGEDTIFVYWSLEVKFKFHSDNQAIRQVRFLVDEKDLGFVNSDSGSFGLPVQNMGKGLHDLSIRIYTSSGTGSFADEFGVEGFVSSKTWKLYIQDSYNPAMTRTVENGLLHIKWNPYHASNFKEYIICKWGEYGSESEIFRTQTTEFIDSSYVGEQTRYFLKVATPGNNSTESFTR
jgi:hypothetical protein